MYGNQQQQQQQQGYNPNATAFVPNAQAGAYYPGAVPPAHGMAPPAPGGAYGAGYTPNPYVPHNMPPQPHMMRGDGAGYYPGYGNYGQPGYVPQAAGLGRYDNQSYNATANYPMGAAASSAAVTSNTTNHGAACYPTPQNRPEAPTPAMPQPARPAGGDVNARTTPAQPPAPAPRRKGGATLSLGKKKPEGTAGTGEGAKTQETTLTETSPRTKSDAETGCADVPTTTSTTRVTGATELTREAVRKELARQREQSKKQFVRDPRPHFNVVFCGHVDAGKSTISGHLLMEKGLVDQREMDKLRREAEIHHREGWEFAYVMDVSEEERSKGITRETGAAYFETEKRRVTVLDAPGHKAFVPSMIGGATQADICVLVISSRTGEFETGFEKGGQTREHAMLVRTCGVKQMICVVNKMDEMHWSKDRYDEIVGKLKPFLRQNGYDEERAKNLVFIPVAGLTGENLIKHTESSVCDWYTGPTWMDVIDNLVLPETRREDDVLCIPLVGSYKDDGRNYIYGKVESGSIAVGEKLQLLPTKQEGVVEGISIEATEFEKCYPGDNVHLKVRGIDESDVHAGYVATSVPTSLRAVEYFQARVVILEVKNIISAGSRFMLHVHSAQEEASFGKLFAKLDRKTGKVDVMNPACAKAGDVVMARIDLNAPLVVEPHKDFDKMGRFMLRDEGKTIAIGLITKLYESTHDNMIKNTKAS